MIVGYARVTLTAKPSTHSNPLWLQPGRSGSLRRKSRGGHR